MNNNEYLRKVQEECFEGASNAVIDDPMRTLKVMEIARLERIADVLEDINSTLISMSAPVETLAECVGEHPARYGGKGASFLRIAGQVDTGL